MTIFIIRVSPTITALDKVSAVKNQLLQLVGGAIIQMNKNSHVRSNMLWFPVATRLLAIVLIEHNPRSGQRHGSLSHGTI